MPSSELEWLVDCWIASGNAQGYSVDRVETGDPDPGVVILGVITPSGLPLSVSINYTP